MFDALLTVILPVVLVALVGVGLGRTFPLDQDSIGKVSLHGLTPMLAFASLLRTSVSLSDGLGLALAFLGSSAVVGILAWLTSRGSSHRTQRAVVACTVLGNNGNFGLPIALLALGQAGLDQAVLIFVFSLVVMFTVGPALLGPGSALTSGLVTIGKLPVTWAMLAALACRMTGWTPPLAVMRAVDLLAQAAVPLVLLSLGIQLATSGRIHFNRAVVTASVLRVVVLPLASLGVGLLVGMRGLPLYGLVLAQAMPTAVNAFMIAREYGTETDTVASVVALTTFASIPSIAFVVSLIPPAG